MCNKDDKQTSCLMEPNSHDVACIEIYEPVCGCDGITYSNTCYAKRAGLVSWKDGECI